MTLHSIRRHWHIILFLAFYFSITAYKLISHPTPFYDWDESIYMQVGTEMVNERSLVPLWQGEAWLEKPPLVPLIYGLIATYIPVQPEISTRIFSLLLSTTVLIFIYRWSFKIFYNETMHRDISALLSTTVIAMTAFHPLFLQKAQTVNTDVWLLLGWLGYLLYYPHFWLSFLYLAIGVLSKSLLGFYPAILVLIFEIYTLFQTKKTKPVRNIYHQFRRIRLIFIQSLMLASWYLFMFWLFRSEFMEVHFKDHLVRRVTQSVESKFGKRTFYIDLIIEYFQYFSILCLVSIGLILKKWFRKETDNKYLLKSFFILPYFAFLNLTKTKIAWYVYPVIPQVIILILYPITLMKKYKPAVMILSIFIILLITYNALHKQSFFTSYYSQYDDTYKMAVFAKDTCSKLYVLPDSTSRQTRETLNNLGLLLSTSDLYGNHAAIVYYFGKKTEFTYNPEEITKRFESKQNGDCFAVEKNDVQHVTQEINEQQFKQFGSINLIYSQ